ncbi:hypothetical protein S83_055256 [Arachis hypogaea]
MLSNHSSFILTFSTSPSSSALQIQDGTSQPSLYTGQPSQPSNRAGSKNSQGKQHHHHPPRLHLSLPQTHSPLHQLWKKIQTLKKIRHSTNQ